jgi:uncharacterized protein involved in response to NO
MSRMLLIAQPPLVAGNPALSPSLLAAAPHRLLFFTGAANVLLAMLWWTLWLVDARWQLFKLPQPAVYAGWMHAIVMQYQVLPPFIFGFLLTVFPRWMNQPALTRWHYLPVGFGLLGGQLLTLVGLAGFPSLLHAGAVLGIAGWALGFGFLLRLLCRDAVRTWHAVSCIIALAFGLVGFVLYAAYLHVNDARLMAVAIKIGTFGLLLPIFVTVAHRMFPFFASAAIVGHAGWRPMPWLAVFWVLAVTHLEFDSSYTNAWLWLPDAGLAVLTGLWLWRNWPRAAMPPLLRVLFAGYAWLPIAMALFAAAERLVRIHRQLGTGTCACACALHRILRERAGCDGDPRDTRPFRPAPRPRTRRRIRVCRDPMRHGDSYRRGARPGRAGLAGAGGSGLARRVRTVGAELGPHLPDAARRRQGRVNGCLRSMRRSRRCTSPPCC